MNMDWHRNEIDKRYQSLADKRIRNVKVTDVTDVVEDLFDPNTPGYDYDFYFAMAMLAIKAHSIVRSNSTNDEEKVNELYEMFAFMNQSSVDAMGRF